MSNFWSMLVSLKDQFSNRLPFDMTDKQSKLSCGFKKAEKPWSDSLYFWRNIFCMTSCLGLWGGRSKSVHLNFSLTLDLINSAQCI